MPISLAQFAEMSARLAVNRHKQDASIPADTVSDESELHRQIMAECRHRLWPFVHSRMDARTTTAKGTPDFVIAATDGRVFWLEAKAGKNKLTPEQLGFGVMLKRNGHVLHEVRSFTQFLMIVNDKSVEHSRHD